MLLTAITETLTPAPVDNDTETSDDEVDGLFSIDPVTGQLKTKGPLDYEDEPYYGGHRQRGRLVVYHWCRGQPTPSP